MLTIGEMPDTVTIETLTEDLVRGVLKRNRSRRDVEYLCRAYLQFGPDAMDATQLQRLCDAINKLNACRDRS